MSRIGDFTDDDVVGWIALSPELGRAMATFSGAVYNSNRLPMRVREMARIVIAHDNECVVCINTRDADGPAAGVDEDLYSHALQWRTWQGFTEQERSAVHSKVVSNSGVKTKAALSQRGD
jgi:AhpD family alkylhydroperoxidase